MTTEPFEALNALLDRAREVELAAMDPKAAIEFVRAAAGFQTRTNAFVARLLQTFDDSGDWALTGAHSAANFLPAQTGTSRASAGGQVNLGRKLAKMPLTAGAFAAAEITEAHVRHLMRCVGPRTITQFEADEAMLVGQAKTLPADVFQDSVDTWLLYADPDGAQPNDEEDTFFISRTSKGRTIGRFDLGPGYGMPSKEAIEERAKAILVRDRKNREIDPSDPGLDRSPGNRRAQAFFELITAGATAKCPDGVRQPAFEIITNPAMVAALAAGERPGPDAQAELLDGSLIPQGLVERWMCDSYVARVMQDAKGVILDMGRQVRIPNKEQRRAVIVRDRCCVVPGCERPANWCDAHHVKWWERDHGHTAVDNLVLMCRWHHTRVHQGHLYVRMVEGVPEVSLADGTVLMNPRTRGPDQVQAA